MKYIHTLRVEFQVLSDHGNWEDTPTQDLINAMYGRLDHLKTAPGDELLIALHQMDVYELDEEEGEE